MRTSRNRFPEQEQEGAGEWIFSYADMMSLLLGFFIILYYYSQTSEDKLQALTKEIAEHFKGEEGEKIASDSKVGMFSEQRQIRALEMLISLAEIAPTMDAAVEKIEHLSALAKISEKTAAEAELLDTATKKLLALSPRDDDAVVEVILPTKLIFESGSNRLNEAAVRDLRRIAGSIVQVERYAHVEVVGHTDSRPQEATKQLIDPWSLSASRAASVAAELVKNGIDPVSIKVTGRAFYQPMFEEYTPFGEPIIENMERNRRVHIRVVRRPLPNRAHSGLEGGR
jgi:chemotaxis protein MotB